MSKRKSNITNRLLASTIKDATANGVPITLTDSELRGLSARISPTGRVTWVASKSIGRGKGSTQRLVIGHYPGMSLTHGSRLCLDGLPQLFRTSTASAWRSYRS